MSHAQFAVSRVACKAIHWRATDGASDRYSQMAIEWTQRSTIEREAQVTKPFNVRPLALNARGAGNALHTARRRTAGSARQLVPRIFRQTAVIFMLFAALLTCGATTNSQMELKLNAKIGSEVQMRININSGKKCRFFLSHAQFAVSRVACKAIHWHPTDGDSDRYSQMAIEWTQRSTIEREAQVTKNFYPAG